MDRLNGVSGRLTCAAAKIIYNFAPREIYKAWFIDYAENCPCTDCRCKECPGGETCVATKNGFRCKPVVEEE
jgi:hypothetical protein